MEYTTRGFFGPRKDKDHSAELRTRLYLSGAINDHWTYGAMLQNTQSLDTNAQESTTDFRRAFVKGDLGNYTTITAGRQAFTIGEGYVADLTGDALKVDFGNKLKTTLFAGRFDSVAYADYNERASVYGAVLNYAFNDKFYTEAAFYAQEGNADMEEQKIYTLGLGYKFDKNLRLYGEYQKAQKDFDEVLFGPSSSNYGDKGWAATVAYKGANPMDVGSWGAYATYYDQSGAVLLDSVSEIEDYLYPAYAGMKGYELGIGYTVAKNAVANLSYYDVETKDGPPYEFGSAKMIWTTVTFGF